jgi:S-adenosylmethionine hydrolase
MSKQILFFLVVVSSACFAQSNVLVLQSDFGMKDGAVAAMKGVALNVSSRIVIHDLTHEIPPFDIWAAAYRLDQAAGYWPKGTVFVSVVDPGVGTDRKPVVMRSKTGHYFVTPDNGTLTLVAEHLGVEAVRIIDEKTNRLPGSSASYTFHGRDVFAYTAARLSSGVITFEEVGPLSTSGPVMITYQKAFSSNGDIRGTVDMLDVQYGNVWTNIPAKLLDQNGIHPGDSVEVAINDGATAQYTGVVYFGKTFGDVTRGRPIAYLNSLLNFSLAINMGNFAAQHHIKSGPASLIAIHRRK